MSRYNFKQLIFEQFFPDPFRLPNPEPTTTTPSALTAPENNAGQPGQSVQAPEPVLS